MTVLVTVVDVIDVHSKTAYPNAWTQAEVRDT